MLRNSDSIKQGWNKVALCSSLILLCKHDGNYSFQTVACKIQTDMLGSSNIAWPEPDTYHASPSLSEKVTYE